MKRACVCLYVEFRGEIPERKKQPVCVGWWTRLLSVRGRAFSALGVRCWVFIADDASRSWYTFYLAGARSEEFGSLVQCVDCLISVQKRQHFFVGTFVTFFFFEVLWQVNSQNTE